MTKKLESWMEPYQPVVVIYIQRLLELLNARKYESIIETEGLYGLVTYIEALEKRVCALAEESEKTKQDLFKELKEEAIDNLRKCQHYHEAMWRARAGWMREKLNE